MTAGQPKVSTRGGAMLPALGLGTWTMGDKKNRWKDEVAALRLGLDLGLNLIDTAEMYGDSASEQVVGEVIRGRRDEVYLVSKVMPSNASTKGTIKAAERSLKHLSCDYMDLYLLHWPGSYPLADTLEAFERLVGQGKIRHYGVSNFDAEQMEDALAEPLGDAICVNQILYNPAQRAIESELLPRCAEENVALMAYSPLDQGSLLQDAVLEQIAVRHGMATATVAIA